MDKVYVTGYGYLKWYDSILRYISKLLNVKLFSD